MYCQENLLQINYDKTKILVFGGKVKKFIWKIQDHIITQVENFTYLAFYLTLLYLGNSIVRQNIWKQNLLWWPCFSIFTQKKENCSCSNKHFKCQNYISNFIWSSQLHSCRWIFKSIFKVTQAVIWILLISWKLGSAVW